MINNMSQGLGSFNNMMPQNNMMQQNPYGQQISQQMGPQMGQQMRSPEMFSEQLMAPNQMNPMEDPMQSLQPMAEPGGFGVYGQSLEGYADGGAASSGGVPRETMIGGQPHMLAYINPEEEQMLYNAGGSGEPGPGGIPAFIPDDGNRGSSSAPMTSPRPRARPADLSSSMRRASSQSASELAYMANARAVQAMAAAERQAAQQAAANAAVVRQEQEMQAVQQAAAQQAAAQQAAAQQAAAQQAAAQQLSNQQMTGPSGGQGTGQGTGQVYPFGSPLPGSNVLASIPTTNDATPVKSESYYSSPVLDPRIAEDSLVADPRIVGQTVSEKILESVPGKTTEKPRRTFEQFLNDLAAPPVYDDTTINFETYGDARAAYNETKDDGRSKFGIPSLLGSAAQAAGGIMAMAGGIRETDKMVGRDAVTKQQIFKSEGAFGGDGNFYVIDGRTGLVRNVASATDASNNPEDMKRQQQSLEDMMADASSNNSPAELAYVANLQAEEQAAIDAINNPVIASSYSPTALTRAGFGGGSNVGSFYDTTPNVVM